MDKITRTVRDLTVFLEPSFCLTRPTSPDAKATKINNITIKIIILANI